jgi:Flp pilus assembly protein TadD
MNRMPARPRRVPTILLALGLAVASLAGCARTVPPPAVSRAQSLIEVGNERFRDGDYAGAAKRYGAAVAAAPGDPAAHYGLGMALAKLGRDEDARAEYARARDLVEQARAQAPDSAS